jgi:hypothetical protein
MKYSRKFPGLQGDDRIYRSEAWRACANCGELTDWVDVHRGVPVCSEECEYAAATRLPPRRSP